MAEQLFSPSWYRVADLTPRMRDHIQIDRHVYGQTPWHVLRNRSTGQLYRFDESANELLFLMDGKRSVQQIWDLINVQRGDEAPTQDETIGLLSHLHAADVLRCDMKPDTQELFRRYRQQRSKRLRQRIANPLAIRIPLFDPERFLAATWPFVRAIFSPAIAVVWLSTVVAGLLVAGVNFQPLIAGGIDQLLSMQNLFLIWLAYPFVKALHELGHAYAVRRWGGEVHDMGVMLLVLVPVPYVDASAASAFSRKHQRVIVGAAGMMVELFLAAIAVFLWVSVEPGLFRAVMFNVIVIAGVSTLFFNGNPLLRFDGYYILADLVEIPNLGSRANRYLFYLLRRYVFGDEQVVSPARNSRERGWFVGYGLASFFYRMFIVIAIALFVAETYPVVGVVIAVWALVTQLMIPLVKGCTFLLQSPALARTRTRAVGTTLALLASVAGGLFLIPFNSYSIAQGVVWSPEESRIRIASSGFVTRVAASHGAQVAAGELLLEARNPQLEGRHALTEARLVELESRYATVWKDSPVQAVILAEEITAVQAALERSAEQLEGLRLTSAQAGKVSLLAPNDLQGRFLQQGEIVGYISAEHAVSARVVVAQEEISRVRNAHSASIRFAESLPQTFPSQVIRVVPAGSNRLPSLALGTSGGGNLVVDPLEKDSGQTLETVFQLDVALPSSYRPTGFGGRVYVRFQHDSEPLGVQAYRRIRQLFLSRFSV